MKIISLSAAAVMIAVAGCTSSPTSMSGPHSANHDRSAPQATISTPSTHSFDETVSRLRAALQSRPVEIFAEVDHAKGAAEAGMTLPPSTLFIFGNPQAGTPIMQANPALGIELPMKILVLETDSGVYVIRQDISAILRQYQVSPDDTPAAKVEDTLNGIVMEAAG
ncbi:MAG: DUF302 domain-containing protein [Henriciella sp.]|uniref:DUF302 domain-containing protein n=1 Tax=Henriciella sp. TaxID=1968823 RepID=UPI003C733E56